MNQFSLGSEKRTQLEVELVATQLLLRRNIDQELFGLLP